MVSCAEIHSAILFEKAGMAVGRPTLSISYAANMNESQKVVGRKEVANDRVWVWPEAEGQSVFAQT